MWDFQKTEESIRKPPAIGFAPGAFEANPESSEAPVVPAEVCVRVAVVLMSISCSVISSRQSVLALSHSTVW
jgi:hypothetical protein